MTDSHDASGPEPHPAPTPPLELEVEIDASAADVWRALTSPEELARWFPLEARVEPGAGGSIWISWGPDMAAADRIAVWEPERHLRTEQGDAPAGERPEGAARMAIDYHIEGRGGKTVLRLVQSGFADGERGEHQREGYEGGWSYFLQNLRHYLERHAGTPRRMVWKRQPVRGQAPEVMAGLLRELFGVREAADDEPAAFGGGARSMDAPPASRRLLRQGQRVAFGRIPSGPVHGTVLYAGPLPNFAATLEELNDGLLFVEAEGREGAWHAGIWVSLYGVPETRATEVETWLTARLEELFGNPT